MGPDEALARADANYYDSMAALAATAVAGEVAERDGVRAVVSGIPVAWLNIIFVTRPPRDAATALQRAVELMDARGVPFVVRIREGLDAASEGAAVDLGLRPGDRVPGMILDDVRSVPNDGAPEGIEVRRVTKANLDDFLLVNQAGFGIPEDVVRQMITPALFDVLDVEAYVGYAGDEPVASSALVVTHRVAGIYNVATMPEHRRRGLGAALTLHAVRRGREEGCVMASLQASSMGRPVYERIGFRVAAEYLTFARPAE